MQLSGLGLFLWAAGLLAHLILLCVLFLRRRASGFPAFTTLIAANVFRTISLFFVYRHGSEDAYFYAYWTWAVADALLQLAVVYEVTRQVLKPLNAWAAGVRLKYGLSLLSCLLVGAALTWLAAPPTHTAQQTFVLKLDFFSSVLMTELFIVTLALSATVGLPWRTHVARIAQGLGVYSVAGIVTETAHNYFGVASGTATYTYVSQARMFLYLGCVAYWTVMLWRDEPHPGELPPELRSQLAAIDDHLEKELRILRG